jgi:hypothetical protein
MTRQRLELLWHSLERQIRWAAAHGGDQELLDLLRHESDRLSATIDQCAPTPTILGRIGAHYCAFGLTGVDRFAMTTAMAPATETTAAVERPS